MVIMLVRVPNFDDDAVALVFGVLGATDAETQSANEAKVTLANIVDETTDAMVSSRFEKDGVMYQVE